MNVEIGTEAAQLPEKEYINGIFLAVYCTVATVHVFGDDNCPDIFSLANPFPSILIIVP
jgi:hypothetical protein